ILLLECAEEWWSGAEGAGAWSGEELSPERESCGEGDKEAEGEGSAESQSMSERDSLRNLSAAIAARQRWEAEAEEAARGALLERVLALDLRLADLLRALAAAAQAANSPGSRAPDTPTAALAHALRDKIEVTEKNVADVVVKKLAELDACKNLMEQYQHSIEGLFGDLESRIKCKG
ncbi:jg900, partial [Pararge aegeria aegeria]